MNMNAAPGSGSGRGNTEAALAARKRLVDENGVSNKGSEPKMLTYAEWNERNPVTKINPIFFDGHTIDERIPAGTEIKFYSPLDADDGVLVDIVSHTSNPAEIRAVNLLNSLPADKRIFPDIPSGMDALREHFETYKSNLN